MHQIAARLLHQFIRIMHSFMAVQDCIHLDITESATRTVPGMCSTIMDSKSVSTKSAISQWTFLLSIQETGQSVSSVKITTIITKKYWFVDKTVCQSSWLFIFWTMSTFVLTQKTKYKNIINLDITLMMRIIFSLASNIFIQKINMNALLWSNVKIRI